MDTSDWQRLQQNLQLPPHTPLKTQIDLLRDDVLKLVAEVMRLKNRLQSAEAEEEAAQAELQTLASESHAAGAEAMRQRVLEVACTECAQDIVALSAERPVQ